MRKRDCSVPYNKELLYRLVGRLIGYVRYGELLHTKAYFAYFVSIKLQVQSIISFFITTMNTEYYTKIEYRWETFSFLKSKPIFNIYKYIKHVVIGMNF